MGGTVQSVTELPSFQRQELGSTRPYLCCAALVAKPSVCFLLVAFALCTRW